MTRPAPTVTVPVEPTEAMRPIPDRVVTEALYWMARAYERVHSMPRVSDTELANKIEAAKADLGRARDASPILSAPAAPQAAGVGEDELKAIARIIFPESERVKMDREWGGNRNHSRARWKKALEQAKEILALRAPSLEPEGGAGDVEAAWQELLEKDDRNSPEDHPDMLLITRDELADFMALATREEAPAEAGERHPLPDLLSPGEAHDEAMGWITKNAVAVRRDNGDMDYSLGAMIAAFEAGRDSAQPQAREALRTMTLSLSDAEMTALEELIAKKDLDGPKIFRDSFKLYQAVEHGAASVTWTESGPLGLPATYPPPAREDAQPGGWLRAADEEMVCAHLGVAEAEDSYETAKKKLASLIQWNIAVAMDPSVGGHPDPDALRVAVEALEKIADARVFDERGEDCRGIAHPYRACRADETEQVAIKALAALQAEQGAKCAPSDKEDGA